MRPDLVILGLALALTTSAYAGPDIADRVAAPKDVLALELAEQRATIDRTLATVTEKLAALDAVRTKRAQAAYRLFQIATPDSMASARRTAVIRLVLTRDAAERTLLSDELAQLVTAQRRTQADLARLATLELPTELARPAHGSVARHFGTVEHERSKVMLSRHGIDLEVDGRAPATAPARGTVRFAGPIRGLDNGVILDHGDYYTVIAKLGDVGVPVGTMVERGDRLGHAARHRVYLEVRVRVGPGGMPIDPEPLLHSRPRD